VSRELIFRDAEGSEYQAVRHYNRQTGNSAFRIKPPGASNETADCIELDTIEELAKAMLIDNLPARVKALAGGPVNYLKFGAQKLVAYELDPTIAGRLGVPAASGGVFSQADRIRRFIIENYVSPARERNDSVFELVSGEVHNAMGLQNALPAVCSALEGKALAEQAKVKLIDRHSPIESDKPSSTIRYRFELQNIVMLDMAAFERLKKAFLSRHPDFTSFAETPSFASNEGDYKQELVEEAQRLLISMRDASDAELGEALIEMLAGRTKLFCNLIDWHAMSVIDKARKANPGLFEAAAGRMVRTDGYDEAVVAFVNAIWAPLRGDPPINPYAESRMLSTMLRALVDPQSVLPIRSTPTDNASRMLCGRPVFGNGPLSRDELTNVTSMAKEMMQVMDQEWGWSPRNLWDVQGFIWETCQKVLRDDAMTDDELLMRFDGDERFRVARAAWSAEQKRAFCSIARTVHNAGLDWYHTNIPEIRFGRKNDANRDASGTLGSVQLRSDRAFLAFSHQNDKLGLEGSYEFNDERAADFASTIEEADAALSDWKPTETKRAGRWPDEYKLDHVNSAGSQALMEPTNLILYGPPGTGKTYRTMEVAVRYCGEFPSPDREELRKQYERLRKDKRIEFVTFHQNFAYEEFVEGLRPQTGESESDGDETGFRLEPVAGIFRQLCTRADEARKSGGASEAHDLEGRNVFKMSLGRAGLEDEIFEDAWTGGYVVLGWGGEIDWSEYDSFRAIHDRWNDDHPGTHGSDSNIAQVNRFVVDMKPGDIVVVSYGNTKIRAIAEVTGDYEFAPTETRDYNHRRSVKWLRRFDTPIDASLISSAKFSQKSCYKIQETNLDREGLATLLPGDESKASDLKQFVLVIDEINRANVSKVFGELITLIEPDKRLGMSEELTVKLPYSMEPFGVPANLHIIGTMNTADRSIALLDTALRRRFRFEEMVPDTSVSAFVFAENTTELPLAKVLDTMNRRIEYLVDRDHRIGHAFFIGCTTKADVDAVMRDKVIPLLQEYFFDDWNRLAAVLGEKDKGGNFLTCETIEDPMGEGGEPLKSWRVRPNFDEGAYTRLVSARAAPSAYPEARLDRA
jgi:hypothetical protein